MSTPNNPVTTPKLVACPTCKAMSAFDASNPFRPFCSERCQMIDLGDWANERFKLAQPVPVNESDD